MRGPSSLHLQKIPRFCNEQNREKNYDMNTEDEASIETVAAQIRRKRNKREMSKKKKQQKINGETYAVARHECIDASHETLPKNTEKKKQKTIQLFLVLWFTCAGVRDSAFCIVFICEMRALQLALKGIINTTHIDHREPTLPDEIANNSSHLSPFPSRHCSPFVYIYRRRRRRAISSLIPDTISLYFAISLLCCSHFFLSFFQFFFSYFVCPRCVFVLSSLLLLVCSFAFLLNFFFAAASRSYQKI